MRTILLAAVMFLIQANNATAPVSADEDLCSKYRDRCFEEQRKTENVCFSESGIISERCRQAQQDRDYWCKYADEKCNK